MVQWLGLSFAVRGRGLIPGQRTKISRFVGRKKKLGLMLGKVEIHV